MGAGQMSCSAFSIHSCQRKREIDTLLESIYLPRVSRKVVESLTSSTGCCEQNPRSSVADAGASAPLNSTLQAPSYVVSKSPLSAWCCSGLNSHRLNARSWHGRIRRTSMTWTTLTSLSFFTSFWIQAWSPVSSSELPHSKPFSF